MAAQSSGTRSSGQLPGLRRLRAYQSSWLRGDVLAGITVAAYLVPQCMAYGELAGVAPIAGLKTDEGHRPVARRVGVERLNSCCEDRAPPSSFEPRGDRVGETAIIGNDEPVKVLAVLSVKESSEGGEC